MIITNEGVIIRTDSIEIPTYKRSTTGVRVMKLNEGQTVANMTLVKKEEEKDEATEEATEKAIEEKAETSESVNENDAEVKAENNAETTENTENTDTDGENA